jgi:hypothetical protein
MDRPTFWQLIDTIDRAALRSGDEDRAVQPLIQALAAYGQNELQEFEDVLTECLYDIDSEAHADAAGESGKSGDGFLYARCYVVASGETYYQGVLSDPAKMPRSIEQWCEPLLYAAPRAWAASTGNDEESWEHQSPLSYETGSNEAKWS